MKKHLLLYAFLAYSSIVFGQWTSVNYDEEIGFLSYLDVIDEQSAYGRVITFNTGKHVLYKTEDGGSSWSELPYPNQGSEQVYGMDFYASGSGVVLIYDPETLPQMKVYQTLDDGQNWSMIGPDSMQLIGLGNFCVQFLDDDHGFVGIGQVLYSTKDGGDSWSTSEFSAHITSIDFESPTHGAIGFFDGTFNYFGGIYCTTDGGQTFEGKFFEQNYTDIIKVVRHKGSTYAFTSDQWIESANRYIHRSVDNGVSWDSILVDNQDSAFGIFDFVFNDDDELFVGLYNGIGGRLVKRSAEGQVWQEEANFDALESFYIYNNANLMYISGGLGVLYKNQSISSLQENPLENQVLVYPNPVTPGGFLHLDSIGDASQIFLYDIQGRLVHTSFVFSNQVQLPMRIDLGVYTLNIKGKNINKHLRIVVN